MVFKNYVVKSSHRDKETGFITPLKVNRGLGGVPLRRDQKLTLRDENALKKRLEAKALHAEKLRELADRMPDSFLIRPRAPKPAEVDPDEQYPWVSALLDGTYFTKDKQNV